MKKFLILLLGAVFLLSSCKEYQPKFTANVVGNADGNVEVVFQGGDFSIDGAANLKFDYTIDTATVVKNCVCLTSSDAAKSSDKNVRQVAEFANSYTDDIKVNADAGATYYLEFDLYFLEPVSGTEVHTHKVLTNRKE